MSDEVPPIETERLRLHALRGTHREALTRLLGDPKVMRFSLSGPLDAPGVDAWMERHRRRAADPRFGFRAMMRRDGEEFVGICGLLPQRFDEGAGLEIAYRLLPDAWGEGLATEAARACRSYAENEFGTEPLFSFIEPANAPSIAVAERVGLRWMRSIVWWGRVVRIYATGESALSTPMH